jgi:hypothetical protein
VGWCQLRLRLSGVRRRIQLQVVEVLVGTLGSSDFTNKFLSTFEMEFDRPVFHYPLIGSDGTHFKCASFADFKREFDNANYWRLQCLKEKDRTLSTNCPENPNVKWGQLVKDLTLFFSEMLACQRRIEQVCLSRANQMKCLPAAEPVKHHANASAEESMRPCAVQVESETKCSQKLQASQTVIASVAAAPQNQFQSAHFSLDSSMMIYYHIQFEFVCIE